MEQNFEVMFEKFWVNIMQINMTKLYNTNV
jgi:hypothetical protein